MKQLLALVIVLVGLASPAFAQKKPSPKAPVKKVAAETAASILRGKPIYTQYCQSCHHADGGGGAATLKPPLSNTSHLMTSRSKVILRMLMHLRRQNINGGDLTDQQLADVLTYLRNSFGNKGLAVPASEVPQIRKVLFLKSTHYEHSAADTMGGWR